MKPNSTILKAVLSISIVIPSPLVIADENQSYEEVLVTAQKRTQSVQDVPISLSVMTEQLLRDRQIQQIPDLAFHVPNMQLSGAFGNGQPVYAIRGVTTADYNANQSSSIGVYVDEAHYVSVFTHGAQLFDIERVEALRGPQGTLYGKNTTGGSINIHSNSPEINTETQGNVALELGNYDYHRLDIAAQSTLVDNKAAARFAFYRLEHDGYVDNKIGDDMTAANNWGGRLSLLWQVSEKVETELKLSKIRMDGRATAPRAEGRIPAPSGLVDISGYQRQGLDFHESEIDYVGDTELDLDAAVLQVAYQGDSFDVISVTAWNQAEYSNFLDVDGSPFIQDHNPVLGESDSWSQDFRIQSSGDELFSYIAGLYISEEQLDTSTSYRLYGSPNVFQLDSTTQPLGDLLTQFGTLTALMDITRESQALYGQTRWEFNDQWGLDIGLRYTHDKDTLDYANVSRYQSGVGGLVGVGTWAPGNITEGGLNIDAPFIPPGVLSPSDPGVYTDGPFTLQSIDTFSVSHNEWTGKIGVDYQWSDKTMLFASVSRGYRSGNFLGGAYYIDRGQNELYAAPEFINAYEVGSKHTSKDQRLRISSALFYYDYSDMQFVNIVGVTPELENAGEANILGVELDVGYRLTDALGSRFTLGYLDTEYSDLALADADGNSVELSGNRLISAPRWNVTAGVDYQWLFNNGASLTAILDMSFQSDQYFSAYNDKEGYDKVSQGAYSVFNGQLVYERDNWQIKLWSKNLLDKEYDTYALGLIAGLGFDMYTRGTPRTFGASFSYQF